MCQGVEGKMFALIDMFLKSQYKIKLVRGPFLKDSGYVKVYNITLNEYEKIA